MSYLNICLFSKPKTTQIELSSISVKNKTGKHGNVIDFTYCGEGEVKE
jgi:hypothetical protein